MKREDIRPDEGKQLQDDIAIKGKIEEGTELRLLDPSTLDQPEKGEEKSGRSKGRLISIRWIFKWLSDYIFIYNIPIFEV